MRNEGFKKLGRKIGEKKKSRRGRRKYRKVYKGHTDKKEDETGGWRQEPCIKIKRRMK